MLSNDDALNDAFTIFASQGYTKDVTQFGALMGRETEESAKKKSEDDTELSLEDGSLDSQESRDRGEEGNKMFDALSDEEKANVEALDAQYKDFDVASLKNDGGYQGDGNYQGSGVHDNRRAINAEEQKAVDDRIAQRKSDADIIELKARGKDRAEKEENAAALANDESFESEVSKIDADLIAKDGTESIESWRERLAPYGIVARLADYSDDVILTNSKGVEYHVEMDNWTEDGNVEVSNEAQQWIKDNAIAMAVDTEQEQTITGRALKAKEMRSGGRVNSDGTTSSVNMVSYEEDGKFKVVPTLFPIDPNIQTSNADAWYDLGLDDAKLIGAKRGEIFTFNTQKEANNFMAGNYELVDTVDEEMRRLYDAEGYDYDAQDAAMTEYDKVQDDLAFLTENAASMNKEYTDEEKEKFAEYFDSTGQISFDRNGARMEALEEQRVKLIDAMFDDEKFEELREKSDIILQKKLEANSRDSFAMQDNAQISLNVANKTAIDTFGMNLEQLKTYVPKTPEEVVQVQAVLDEEIQARLDAQMAAEKYQMGQSYYDAKNNKNLVKEYAEGFTATKAIWNDGWANGLSAEQILLQSMNPNATDMELLNAAQIISDSMASRTGDMSKQLGRFHASRNVASGEVWKNIDNPQDFIKWGIDLAASSMSMMLPYGSWLVGGSVVAGTATGTTIGATGFLAGPTGILTTAGGALTGAAQGLTVGMAATSFAMEYTNAVLDAARNRGYDMSDPEQGLAALKDDAVWAEGLEIGLKRGIPIAIADMLSGGVAGRVFTAGKAASTSVRIAQNLTGRLVVDPLFEGAGEFAAQVSAGQDIDGKEILAEMGGAVGSKTPNMVMNTVSANFNNNTERMALNFADPKWLGKNQERGKDVMAWADRNQKTGNITEEQADNIRKNVGDQRTASKSMRENGHADKANSTFEGRLVELEQAKREEKAKENSDSETLAAIEAEKKEMFETGKVRKPAVEDVKVKTPVNEEEEVSTEVTEDEVFEELNKRMEARGNANGVASKEEIDSIREELQNEKNNPKVEEEVVVEEEVATEEEISDFEAILNADILTEEEQATKEEAVAVEDKVAVEVTPKIKPLGEQNQTTEEQMAAPKSTIIGSTNLGNGYKFQANEPSNNSIYRGGLETRHDQAGNYVDGRSIVITEKKAKDAVTKKQGLLRKTVEVSPAVEGEILVQARATKDSFGNQLKGSRGSSSVYSTIIVNPSVMENMTEEQKDEYLVKVQQEVKADLKSKMDAIGNMEGKSEIEIENALNKVAQESEAGPKFQTEEGASEVKAVDVQKIAEEMNAMPETEISFEAVAPSSDVKIEPSIEAGITDKEAQALGFADAAAMNKQWEDFKGLPMFPAMSDILSTGIKEDSMGKPMETQGGLHFNTVGKEKLAWAGVTKDGAQQQVDKALAIYKAHKAVYDEAWESGRIPYGQVLMAVVRMGKGAVDSNEAVFRFIGPHVKSFSKANRVAAMEAINADIAAKAATNNKKDQFFAAQFQAFITENNITDLGVLMDAIVLDADKSKVDKQSALSLPAKAFMTDLLFGNGQTSNRAFIKALMGDTKAKSDVFTRTNLYNKLGDPSMMQVGKGNVVAIQGVNVLEDVGVGKSKHRNYAWGPKGGLVAFISNPTHGLNLFSTWRAKSNRMAKTDKAGKMATDAQVADHTGGAFFADSAFVGDTMASTDTIVEQVIAKIRFAFPNVQVTNSKVEWQATLADPRVKKRMNSKGQIIYGITMDGKIVLNPDLATAGTAIHEFGHIWVDYLSTAGGRKGAALLEKGKQLVRGSVEHKKQMEIYGDTDLALEEAIVEMMANKGETIVKASLKSKFKTWMNGMFKYIQQTFTTSKELSMEDIESLSLEDFINTGLADLFSGKAMDFKFDASQAESAQEARFAKQLTEEGRTQMNDIIQKGREVGVTDAVVRAILRNRGFSATTIDAVMDEQMHINLIDIAPAAFRNVEEGALAGKELFADVLTKVNEEVRKMRKRVKGLDIGQVRKFALDTLKADSLFISQDQQVQAALIIALDSHFKIKKNANVSREVAGLKARLKSIKDTEQGVKAKQAMLAQFIRKVLPTSLGYTKTQVQTLINATLNTNKDTFLAQAEKVMDIVQQQTAKMVKIKQKQLLKLAKKNGKGRKTQSGKTKGKGIGVQAQSFFQAAEQVIVAVLKNDQVTLDAIRKKLQENQAELDALQLKEDNKEKLTNSERSRLDEAEALEMFEKLNEMSLEEVVALLEDTEAILENSKEVLKAKRAQRAEAKNRLEYEAIKQLRENNPELFDADGNVLDDNQLKTNRATDIKLRLRAAFRNLAGFNPLNHIKNLTTILATLDGKGKTQFLTKNVLDKLNAMISNHQKGRQAQTTRMDAIAQKFGVKNYKAFRKKFVRGAPIVLKNLTNGKGVSLGERSISRNQAMRLVALSMNAVQNAKLVAQGVNVEQLKAELGPEVVAFVEQTVQYLSTEYFDSINEVHANVNDVNLPYQENYFPTQTLAAKDAALMENDDFSGVFNAETAPALKDRTNTKDDVALFEEFTQVLESHFDSMEKFKAMAQGVKEIAMAVNLPSIKSLLKESGMSKVVNERINAVVNDQSLIQNTANQNKISDFFMNAFVSYVLSLKLIQIPKQMSSFINGFQDYRYNVREKNEDGTEVGGLAEKLINEPIDMVMYIAEWAKSGFGLGNLKQAMEISPLFRQRVLDAIRGDVASLETGRSAESFINDETKFGDILQIFQTAKGASTTIGDILGVMGYMTTYNQNIKPKRDSNGNMVDGMSKAEALRLFEDYNSTQQSKRNTDKSGIQLVKNSYVRFITAFLSSPMLYLNNVHQALGAIKNSAKMKEAPSTKDMRKFYLNLGAAQAMFVAMSSMFQFIKGDKDDEELYKQKIKNAMLGLNLLESIPLMSDIVEQAGEDSFGSGIGVNPFSRIAKDARESFEEGYGEGVLKIGEMMLGFNLDPVRGGIDYMGAGKDEDYYEWLGVSKSYRPGYGGGATSGGSGKKKTGKKSEKKSGEKKGKTGKR